MLRRSPFFSFFFNHFAVAGLPFNLFHLHDCPILSAVSLADALSHCFVPRRDLLSPSSCWLARHVFVIPVQIGCLYMPF